MAEPEPNQPKFGWQQKANQQLQQQHIREEVWLELGDPARALLWSQHGPLASALLTVLPTSRARIDAQPFRLLLCRRLHFPRPLIQRTLDKFGHHRAACAEAGVLVRMRGSTGLSRSRGLRHNKRAGLGQSKTRSRGERVDFVEGCAIGSGHDSVSPLSRNGAANHDGAALDAARKRKEDEFTWQVVQRRRVIMRVTGHGYGGLDESNDRHM